MAATSTSKLCYLFDIRNVIGLLMAIYGVVLTIAGFAPALLREREKGAGDNPVDLYFGTDAKLVGRTGAHRRRGRFLRVGGAASGSGRGNRLGDNRFRRTADRLARRLPLRNGRLEFFLVGTLVAAKRYRRRRHRNDGNRQRDRFPTGDLEVLAEYHRAEHHGNDGLQHQHCRHRGM